MSDLIRREDAYRVLTEYYHQRTDFQHMALKEALDRVPSAEPKVGKWIPCEERMPKAFENPVLVSGYKGYVSLGWWNGKEFETATRLPHIDVKAWQPLPEPYEMERSE